MGLELSATNKDVKENCETNILFFFCFFFLFSDSVHALLLSNYASLYLPSSILLLVTHTSPGVRQSRMFQSLKCLSEQMRTGEKQDLQLRLQRGNINVFMRKAILQWDQQNLQRVCAHWVVTTADLLEQWQEQATVEEDYWNIIIIVLLH